MQTLYDFQHDPNKETISVSKFPHTSFYLLDANNVTAFINSFVFQDTLQNLLLIHVITKLPNEEINLLFTTKENQQILLQTTRQHRDSDKHKEISTKQIVPSTTS
ncbi:unnamed protein product [Rotaria sp. Silwood2]|nr:unnamed protein product [Rotaria sp. Silwood2]